MTDLSIRAFWPPQKVLESTHGDIYIEEPEIFPLGHVQIHTLSKKFIFSFLVSENSQIRPVFIHSHSCSVLFCCRTFHPSSSLCNLLILHVSPMKPAGLDSWGAALEGSQMLMGAWDQGAPHICFQCNEAQSHTRHVLGPRAPGSASMMPWEAQVR